MQSFGSQGYGTVLDFTQFLGIPNFSKKNRFHENLIQNLPVHTPFTYLAAYLDGWMTFRLPSHTEISYTSSTEISSTSRQKFRIPREIEISSTYEISSTIKITY